MVDGISSSLGGLQNAVTAISTASRNIASASASGTSNLDGGLVSADIASVQYTANVKMLKAQFDDEKRLLDILA